MLSSGPGEVFLDQQRLAGAPGSCQDLPDPPGRGHRGDRVVGAQDALAGAERDGFDHARESRRPSRLADGVLRCGGGHDLEPRLGHAGGCPPLPLPGLAGGVQHGIDRVVRQPHPRGYGRCQHQHRGVCGDCRGGRSAAGQDAAGAAVRVAVGYRDNRAAAQRQRAVAADDQVQAHPAGGQQEVSRAVGAGGHQQQHPWARRRWPARNRDHLAGHRFSAEKNGSVPAS
jgi:hypothetical protein